MSNRIFLNITKYINQIIWRDTYHTNVYLE